MRGIAVRKHVSISLSGNDWDLYTETSPIECSTAAERIDETIEYWFNKGCDRKTVRQRAVEKMSVFAHVGATDSEPLQKLEQVLDELYK